MIAKVEMKLKAHISIITRINRSPIGSIKAHHLRAYISRIHVLKNEKNKKIEIEARFEILVLRFV